MDKPAATAGISAAALDWDDLRHALAVARVGSLAAAARSLGVDQTTVARRLKALESTLGTPLFERHQGRMALTAAGEVLAERGERIEREVAALAHLAADRDSQVRGTVRITAVDALVGHYLGRHLADLRGRHPGLAVEFIASSATLNLVRREADIAIRLARPREGDLVARRLGRLAYAVYGPAGSAVAGGWKEHPWVAYERSLAQVPEMRWLSERVGEEAVVLRCNNMDALAQAVADGQGLAILPLLVGARHPGLACCSGAEPVLFREMWLAYPRELRGVPRIRAVSDWLVERFAADAGIFAPPLTGGRNPPAGGGEAPRRRR